MLIQFNIKGVKGLEKLLQEDDNLIPTDEQMQNPSYHHQDDLTQPIDSSKLIASFVFNKDREVYLTVNFDQEKRVYADGFNELQDENQYLLMDALNEDLQDNKHFTQAIDIRFLYLLLENNPDAEYFEVEITKDNFLLMIE